MSKNKLTDLNDHLFICIENLMDDDLCSTPEETTRQIDRAKAVSMLADSIIDICNTQLKAAELQAEYGKIAAIPKSLCIGSD